MSAETFTPRNGEVPGYWEAVKHVGGRALRWVLGIENPYTQSRSLPNKAVSGAKGGLVHKTVEVPTAIESPAASSWQRVRNYPGYETPGVVQRVEAPQAPVSYLGGLPSVETVATPEPIIRTVEGGVVLGGQPSKEVIRNEALNSAGHVIGLSDDQSRHAIDETSVSSRASNLESQEK